MFTTIRQGERFAVWDRVGQARLVDGPRRLFAWGRRFDRLTRHAAGVNEYLEVNFLDGRREHLPGPIELWFDPLTHRSVVVRQANEIGADQAALLVAYLDDRVERRRIEGPAFVVPAPNEKLLWLDRYCATEGQYLVVEYADGRREHIRGPAALWEEPGRHRKVEVKDALPVSANEAVVVYARKGGEVSRRVVRGPWMFVPEAEEWLHEFSWHGTGPGGRKAPHVLKFVRLRVIPDQMYHDVEEVRTADDALVTVRLMVFFELTDIERMLDQTHDPVADFINDLAADVVAFAGKRLFEDFKRDGEALNDLAQYPNLTRRAEGIGYRINKVVYRGYAASQKLQTMHDSAIEARTGLKLEAETERQAQELADLKQRRELERQARDRDNETAQKEHALALLRREHEETLRSGLESRRQESGLQREADEVRLSALRQENEAREAFCRTLSGMGVDLTRYLVAQYQHPDRIIRVDGAAAAVQLTNP